MATPQQIPDQEAPLATTTIAIAPSIPVEKTTSKPKKVVSLPSEVEKQIVKRLGENHPLVQVARCESEYRQFAKDGSVLRGKQNPQDVGVLQINEKYHLAASKSLGYNIYTLEGNIDYGEYLYKHKGLKPWSWSSSCWNTTITD